jgi:hypothetical protein
MIFGKGVNELCDQWRFRVPHAGFGTELVFILGRYGLEGLAFVEIGGEWVKRCLEKPRNFSTQSGFQVSRWM